MALEMEAPRGELFCFSEVGGAGPFRDVEHPELAGTGLPVAQGHWWIPKSESKRGETSMVN